MPPSISSFVQVQQERYSGITKVCFLAGSTPFIPHTAMASMAEVLAMRDGLNLAIKTGCNRIQAESDSIEMIEACNGEAKQWQSHIDSCVVN
jgi:hypothetical protein